MKSKDIRIDGISFGLHRKTVLAKLGKPNGPISGQGVDSFGADPATVVAYSRGGVVNFLYGQTLEVTANRKVRAGDSVATLAKVLGAVPARGTWEFADGMLGIRADRLGHIKGFELNPFLR